MQPMTAPAEASPLSVPRLQALRDAGMTFFTGVPDSEFRSLIQELEGSVIDGQYVLATREDSAIAIATGAALAGERPLVFMESSGFGNTLDVLTSLAIAYEVPLVLLIAWAGFQGRDVPHHNAIGEPLEGLLAALDLPVEVLADLGGAPEELGRAVEAASAAAREAGRPAVVLGVPAKFAGDREGR